MANKKLKVKKLHPDAIIPTRSNPTDSGLDLYALEDTLLAPGEVKLLKTGVAFEIPEGFEIQVRPRSGMSLKTKFRVANAPGTVDRGYTGDISVIGHNVEDANKFSAVIHIKKGDRIAQAVMCPVEIPELVEVEDFQESVRKDKGFGSSGL